MKKDQLRSLFNGGGIRDRTVDPLLAKQMLYQLSYAPDKFFFLCFKRKMRLNGGGIRDRTVDPLLAKQMLYQLSYTPSKF